MFSHQPTLRLPWTARFRRLPLFSEVFGSGNLARRTPGKSRLYLKHYRTINENSADCQDNDARVRFAEPPKFRSCLKLSPRRQAALCPFPETTSSFPSSYARKPEAGLLRARPKVFPWMRAIIPRPKRVFGFSSRYRVRLMRNSAVPFFICLVCLLLASAMQSLAQDNEIHWLDNYRETLQEAKRTQKPIFLEFRCEP